MFNKLTLALLKTKFGCSRRLVSVDMEPLISNDEKYKITLRYGEEKLLPNKDIHWESYSRGIRLKNKITNATYEHTTETKFTNTFASKKDKEEFLKAIKFGLCVQNDTKCCSKLMLESLPQTEEYTKIRKQLEKFQK